MQLYTHTHTHTASVAKTTLSNKKSSENHLKLKIYDITSFYFSYSNSAREFYQYQCWRIIKILIQCIKQIRIKKLL
jgi:hypothetical protein